MSYLIFKFTLVSFREMTAFIMNTFMHKLFKY